jgi:hypothetical protein
MGYLESLSEHWESSIARAKQEGANEIQIQALESLAEYEFGYGTDMRLCRESFWETRVDKDGDLLLYFAAPWKIDKSGKAVHGESVRVAIDHYGILTQKNLVTGASFIHDPHAEYAEWSGKSKHSKMVWTLDDRMMRDMIEPGLVPITCIEGDSLLIVDTRERVFPFFPTDTFAHRHDIEPKVKLTDMYVTSRWDGPLTGFIRVDGQRHYFSLALTEDVSGTRVYALHELFFSELLKTNLNNLLSVVERKIFRHRVNLPKFQLGEFTKNNVVGYFA